MTAIVGFVDTDKSILIGGDAAGTSNNGSQDVYTNRKVFQPKLSPEFIVGSCGSFRLAQVLHYQFSAPRPLPGPLDDFEEYVSTDLSKVFYTTFKEAGLFDESIGEGINGSFLIGYQGVIAHVQSNLQAMISQKPYCAAGCATEIVRGAMFATESVTDSVQRIYLALRAAAEFSSSVKEPFKVMRMVFDPEWNASKGKQKRGKAK